MYSCPTGTDSYEVQSGDSLWQIARRYHTTIQALAAANPGVDVNNLYIGQIICIPQSYNGQPYAPYQPAGISPAQETLSNHLRMLWEQHVYWTRMAILSIIFGLQDTQAVTNRLLRNATDFEDALGVFYGDEVAAQFAELFTKHITIAAELIQALKAGNDTAAADVETRWYENAAQIAEFLGSINPYWSTQAWQNLLYNHLAMIKDEIIYLLDQNYTESITTFEDIEKEALEMADSMTGGIVSQFPQYFRMNR